APSRQRNSADRSASGSASGPSSPRASELSRARTSSASAGRAKHCRSTKRSSTSSIHRLRGMEAPGDLRDWIALLEREGELVRVAPEVDPHLEITEIVDRTVKAGGPALLFERPKGSTHPLLINQFGTERRMCLAFGADRLDDVARKVSGVLEMQPPSGLLEKVRGLQQLKSIADSLP